MLQEWKNDINCKCLRNFFSEKETMGDTEVAEGEASGANIPEIELIIRASTIDGRRKGACLFCQVIKIIKSKSNLFYDN